MKLKTVKCSYCGAEHEQVSWASKPFSCGQAECERQMIDDERARQDEAREAAEDDGYGRYL
jgi:hypothetical protein